MPVAAASTSGALFNSTGWPMIVSNSIETESTAMRAVRLSNARTGSLRRMFRNSWLVIWLSARAD
jgi:hypothetical protein